MINGKPVRVYGHPRSGNNYLLKLLSMNFYDEGKTDEYIYHKFIDDPVTIREVNSTVMFFIHRNTDAVVDSVYHMRERYTFNEHNYERFKRTRINDMYDKEKAKCTIYVDSFVGNGVMKDINDIHFGAYRHMTVPQEVEYFNSKWREFATQNGILIVDYDDLLKNFNTNMLRIAKYIGSSKTEFKDIVRRIGYIPMDNDGKERAGYGYTASSKFMEVKNES